MTQIVEPALAQRVAGWERASWGIQKRTDLVTLTSGDRVVLQRYQRRADAAHRVRVMRALWKPAAEVGIAVPRVREADLNAHPAWIIFDALPGVPVPAAGEAGLGGPRFPVIARLMGELLATFRRLSIPGLDLDDLWSDPQRLAGEAGRWATRIPRAPRPGPASWGRILRDVPHLFAERPVALAHGDFAPANVLTDGVSITGLLDCESIRLADPLFDVAWWAWSVSFAGQHAFEAAWPEFLAGAGIDPTDSDLANRVESLQVLRMLELLADQASISPQVRQILTDHLTRLS